MILNNSQRNALRKRHQPCPKNESSY